MYLLRTLLLTLTAVVGFTQCSPLNTPLHTQNENSHAFNNAKQDPPAAPQIHCIDENNHVVDWVIVVKLPRTHGSPNPLIVNGEAYLTVSSEDVKRHEERQKDVKLHEERQKNVKLHEERSFEQRKTSTNDNGNGKNTAADSIEKTTNNGHDDKSRKKKNHAKKPWLIGNENHGSSRSKNVKNKLRNGSGMSSRKDKVHKKSKHSQAHGKRKNENEKLNRESKEQNKSIHSKTQNERTNEKLNNRQNKERTEHSERKLSTPLIPNPLITQLDDFEKDLKAHQIEHIMKKATNNNTLLESENSTSTWFETVLFNALKRKVNDNSLEEKDIQLLFHDEDKPGRRKVVRRDVNALDTLIGGKLDLWNVENGQQSEIPASEFESLMKSGQKQFSQRSTVSFSDEIELTEDGLKEHNQVEHIQKAGENFKSIVDHITGGLRNELVARDNSGLRDNWADVMDRVRALELLNNMERIDDAHNMNTFESNLILSDSLKTSGHKNIHSINGNLGIHSNEGLDSHTNEGVNTHSNGAFANNQMWVDRFVNLGGQLGGPDELDRFKYSIGIGPVEDRHARDDIDSDPNEATVRNQSPHKYKSAETIHGEKINIGDAEELDASNESVESQSVVEQMAFKQDSPQEENFKEEEDASEDSLQWTLSKHSIRDSSSLPGRLLTPYLFNSSFSPLFTEDGVKILYNDQTPANKTTVSFGHSKGLLVGNSLGGIWVVHSVPHFVDDSLAEYSYPHTGLMYGQNMLCLTLNASTLDSVGSNLGVNQIYKYSTFMSERLRSVYPTLAKVIDGSFVPPRENFLVHDFSTSYATPEAFHSFAKTKELGQDLYKVIGDQLGVSLLVETWPNGPGRLRSDCRNAGHFVENVASIGAAGVVSYRSTHDHAKWAISFGNETTRTGKSFGGFWLETKTKNTKKAALSNLNQTRTKTELKDEKIQEALYEKANELDGSFESVFKRIEDLAALDGGGDNWRVDVNENSVEMSEKEYQSSVKDISPISGGTGGNPTEKDTESGTTRHVEGKDDDINEFVTTENKRRTLKTGEALERNTGKTGETLGRNPAKTVETLLKRKPGPLIDIEDNGLLLSEDYGDHVDVDYSDYSDEHVDFNVAVDAGASASSDDTVVEDKGNVVLTTNQENLNHKSANHKNGNHKTASHESADAVKDNVERVDYWVCNGDINRAEDQLKRGGGSVCMNNKAVWTLYQELINGVEPCPVYEQQGSVDTVLGTD